MLLNKDITYWKHTATRDAFGKPGFEAPIIIKGDYSDKTELASVMNNRQAVGSLSEISDTSFMYIDRKINIGDYVCIGDKTAFATPTEIADSKVVKGIRSSVGVMKSLQEHKIYF